MEIKKTAIAGTTESCDVQIVIAPNSPYGRKIVLDSNVKVQFGDAILQTVQEELDRFGITDALVQIHDKGAFDWVIRARMQAVVCRAADIPFSWKEA